jgi:hypothetical protein
MFSIFSEKVIRGKVDEKVERPFSAEIVLVFEY